MDLRTDQDEDLGTTESVARLQSLADNLPHAMIYQIRVEPDGVSRNFTFVGESCERLNGVSREAVLADPGVLYGLIAPEDLPALIAAEAAAMTTGGAFDLEAAFIRPDGERRWSRISSAPRFLPDGASLWDGIQLDITDSRRARDALVTEQDRLALVLEATGLGLWDYDISSGRLEWDDGVRAVYGMPADAVVGFDEYAAAIHPEDREIVLGRYGAALASGARGYTTEHRTLGPDGQVRWVLGSARILRDAAGVPVRVIGSTMDITERKRGEERLQLMVHELNHRVKNSMAVVQSISRRTLQTSASPEEAEQRLTARLVALAQAHDLLTAESWEGADLAEVVSRTLATLGVSAERVFVEGPGLRLRPNSAVTLSLVFHELATNAIKYGALSREGGRIGVSWSIDTVADLFQLGWRETGGPPVSQPTRRGFGVHLIERGLATELGGEARIDYAPEGVICTVRGSLARLG